MTVTLDAVLNVLRVHERELRRMGISHVAVFGSVARGEATEASDIDILVDLDPEYPIGVFEFARVKIYISEILGRSVDVVSRRALKAMLRNSIVRDAVNAF